MVTLSIIILNYNTKEFLRSCLKSVYGNLKGFEFEVIVVDNASKDGSTEMVNEYFKRAILIVNKENVGFAKGCNIGTREAKGKHLLFLNSDTEVKDRGFLKMVEFLDSHGDIGILGGKLLNPDGSPQPSSGKFYTLFNLFLMLAGAESFLGIRKSPNTISKVDWVSGGCMMVKKSLFEKLSGFDENFFMYIEDMELCFRANKLGFLTYFYPNLGVLHKELGSSNRAFAIIHIYQGIIYFYRKHKGNLQYMCAKLLLTIKAYIAILIGSLTNNQYLTTTYKKALKF